MKIKFILLFTVIAISFTSCVSTKSTLQNVNDNAPIPQLTASNTFVITEFSKDPKYGYNQTLFPIVQGSVYSDLRKVSAEYIASKGAFGNAIGGLSVGEPVEDMYAMADEVTDILPKDKPRYLMGVGTPANILEGIALGIDMFDCVMPSRNARHGMLFTSEGIINIKNLKWIALIK